MNRLVRFTGFVMVVVGALVILAWLIERGLSSDRIQNAGRVKMLLGAGLIAGEALLGIVMAIPIVVFQDPNVVAISSAPYGG